ncbi:hypothetical protein [Paraburkholderia adhaesiva]|uniref:hypothetical protein n=1 Tax=Paraburkholderia adhaesiva TaxID=2883244 RepID=UPI001F411DB0|nr:hypothetical protein [Paraburkholderia adhaesiva]
MPRSRTVKGGFFRSPDIQHTPVDCRLLFISLWTQADRDGRLEDLPSKIRDEAFPYDFDITEQHVDDLLNILDHRDLILRYVVEGRPLIFITKWKTHQHPHPKEAKSELAPPPDPPANARQSRVQFIGAGQFTPGNDPVHTQVRTDRALSSNTSNTSVSSKPSKPSDTSPSGLKPLSSSRKSANIDADVVAGIFTCWQQTMNSPRSVLDEKRCKVIRAAIAMGYNAEQLCEAIHGCSLTPYNMGVNEGGVKYNGIALILRDAEHIDRFIEAGLHPPVPNGSGGSVDEKARARKDFVSKLTGRDKRNAVSADPNVIDVDMPEIAHHGPRNTGNMG